MQDILGREIAIGNKLAFTVGTNLILGVVVGLLKGKVKVLLFKEEKRARYIPARYLDGVCLEFGHYEIAEPRKTRYVYGTGQRAMILPNDIDLTTSMDVVQS